jgi:hypothetical protein
MRSPLRSFAALVALASAAVPGCDCGLEPLATQPGRVVGVVCDPESGTPVDRGDVVLDVDGVEVNARVNRDGTFTMDRVPPGDASVRLPDERTLEVVVVAGETTQLTDTACRAEPTDFFGAIVGRVCNGHVGQVVAGADVIVVLPNGERLTTITNDDGAFSFADVPVGSHALSVRGDGFSRTEVVVVEADVEAIVDVGGACAIPAPLEVGGVRGRVCTADGARPLVDARAFITPVGGADVSDLTDDDGRFLLEGVPAGNQVLIIQKGTFRSERAVTIPPGEILELDEEECALESDDIRIAVVRGSNFDHVEDVLGSIGVPDDNVTIFGSDWAEQLLSGDERVRDFDVLFLNCRSAEPVYLASAEMQDRLRSYISDGGSLFASDQAYDLIEGTFPDKIDFFGDDNVRAAADRGAIAELTASVVNFSMQNLFGRSTATLRYPLETWSVVAAVSDDVDVYLSANAPLLGGGTVDDAPQIVGFDHGNGRVTYSSFHQEPGSHPDQLRILQLLMFEL